MRYSITYTFLFLLILLQFSQVLIAQKTRVIHTTDIGMDSQDDQNTLVRTLLFSNNQNIIGLIPSGGPWQKEFLDKEYERILAKIDIYAKVYDNLKLHDPDYPTPEYLRSVTARGNIVYDDFNNPVFNYCGAFCLSFRCDFIYF